MIELPPPLLLPDPPAIIRPLDGGLWNDIDNKMQRLGVPRQVRRSVMAEMARVVGGKSTLVKATAVEMARYAKDPALGSMLLNPFLVAPGGGDPSFSFVKFLSGFEGGDTTTTLTDECSSPHTFTANGNAQISTAQFKYGTSSGLFDGSGDYWSASSSVRLSAANSDLFTVEGWVRPASGTTFVNHSMIGRGLSDGNLGWRVLIVDGGLRFGYSPSGSGWTNITTANFLFGTLSWVHWAVNKNASGKIRLFVAGVMQASDTPANSSFFNTTAALQIGNPQFGGDPMNGNLDEIRITQGAIRYDSDSSFTPPAAAFPRS